MRLTTYISFSFCSPPTHSFAQYLYLNGAKKFFQWFDYQSWYPLGRPVGTTIYPGMQFTAVYIKNYLTGDGMSLNDVCCYMPAWFGALATFLIGCLAYECSLPENTGTTLVGVLVDALKGRRTDTSTIDPAGQASRRVLVGLSTPLWNVPCLPWASWRSFLPISCDPSVVASTTNPSPSVP